MKQKYLFLYLKTGGGHLAPARSVASYIHLKYKDKVSTQLWDGFTGINKLVKYCIEDGYRKSQSKAVWTFEMLYALNKISWVAKLTTLIISYFIVPHLERYILTERPDKVVIFHFFLIHPVVRIINKHNLPTRIITVVTDPYTAHPIWFLDKKVSFIVFSDILRNHCLKIGIPPQSISVFPFALSDKFTRPLTLIEVSVFKNNLGFMPGKRIILILGGGDGIPRGKKILKKIIKSNPDAYIVIVCGKNQQLYKKAWKLKTRYNFEKLKIYGFVDFIYELINISDIVITKCGASTFMEILLSGKIPVINNYIWEQEKGNMEFVRNNSLGIYEKNIDKLPEKINNIIHNPHQYNYYQQNINKISLKNGTPQVSEFIVTY